MKWNNNKYLKWGLTFLLFIIGAYGMLKSYGYASETHIETEDEWIYQYPNQEAIIYAKRTSWGQVKPSSDNKRREWQEAYEFHMFQAKRTYQDAYDRVWWLPDLSWRELGRDAWVAACGTAGGSTVCSRLVIAFSTMLSAYGLHCLDEWDYIHDKLYWAEFHCRECDKYMRMLQK